MKRTTHAHVMGAGLAGLGAAIALGVVIAFGAAAPRSAAALTLEEALARAASRNERSRIADEDARTAAARASQARASLLPAITLTGEFRRQGAKGESPLLDGSDRRTATTRLDQALFDPRAWPLLRQALKGRDAARWGAVEAKRRLAYETAEAFLAALSSEQVARAAEVRQELARRSLEEIRLRFEGQLVGSNDVTRAELEAATAEREVVRARGTARTARLVLANLLDEEVADSLVAPTALLDRAGRTVPAASLDLDAATRRRPDLLAERARVAALQAGAWEPLARYLPRVSAFGSMRAIDGTRPTGGDGDWSVGLSGTWSLFDGGQREGERSERAAAARSGRLSLANLERRVALDVESARVMLESEQASLLRAVVAVEAARRNATETTELYRQGLARALEVTDANVQLFASEVERAGVQYALALAYLNLRSALGWAPLEPETTP